RDLAALGAERVGCVHGRARRRVIAVDRGQHLGGVRDGLGAPARGRGGDTAGGELGADRAIQDRDRSSDPSATPPVMAPHRSFVARSLLMNKTVIGVLMACVLGGCGSAATPVAPRAPDAAVAAQPASSQAVEPKLTPAVAGNPEPVKTSAGPWI